MAERATETIKFVGISGPTGAGKDYLVGNATERLGLNIVRMHTTRPRRPEGSENKIPVSEEVFMAYPADELIGKHEDAGIWYAYKLEDLQNAGATIVELNPMKQAEVPDQLRAHGMEMVAWIGLHGEDEYLMHNIGNRQEMSPEELATRLRLSHEFINRLKELSDEGIVTLYKVGWDNRSTMADEFTDMIDTLLNK